MVEEHNHEFEWKRATQEHPYHFVGSGLPNVYLCGIRYSVCKTCGIQAADIPALKNLMIAIARAVVKKPAPLSGAEIRYLRKRLGKKSAEFGRIIGVGEEQVSRWENDKNPPEESADKLIRVFYCALSKDKELRGQLNEHLEGWLAALPREEHTSSFHARLRDHQWTAEPCLAAC
jgi:putative zinc finger/helix-turn-helix YgiT family protein